MSLVDYYENGILKYQYSKKLDLENYVYEETVTLDTKSYYKDGVIFNGTEYAFINKGLACKIWKDGVLENFTVHMFAMHYYNRLLFERNDSIIRITNMLEEGDEIIYNFSNDFMTSSHTGIDGTMCFSAYQNIDVLHLPKSSVVFYIKLGDEMVCRSQNISTNVNEHRQRFHVNVQVYENLKIPKSVNSYDAFIHLSNYFSKKDALDIIFYLDESNSTEEDTQGYVVAIMNTDHQGRIKNGICWVNASPPFYEEYNNGELVKRGDIDIQNFQTKATAFHENKIVVREE